MTHRLHDWCLRFEHVDGRLPIGELTSNSVLLRVSSVDESEGLGAEGPFGSELRPYKRREQMVKRAELQNNGQIQTFNR